MFGFPAQTQWGVNTTSAGPVPVSATVQVAGRSEALGSTFVIPLTGAITRGFATPSGSARTSTHALSLKAAPAACSATSLSRATGPTIPVLNVPVTVAL